MSRFLGGILVLLVMLPVAARPMRCSGDLTRWAEDMTAQLPLFANLILSRNRASFRVVLVGIPEVEQIDPGQMRALGVPDASTQGARVYFTTLERRLVAGSDPNPPATGKFGQRRTEALQLAYQAFLTRTGSDPWQLVGLRVVGVGKIVRDVGNGAIAQAIRSWQEAGCLAASDLELSGRP